MGLNSLRDEFNIHYFEHFVFFKGDVDPTKLKSYYTLRLVRVADLVPEKAPNAIELCKTSQRSGLFRDLRDTKFENFLIRRKSQRTMTGSLRTKKRPKNRRKGVLGGQT